MACRRPHSTIRVRSPPTRTSRPHNLHLTTPLNRRRCQLRQIFTASLEATHDNGPIRTPHPRIIIRLPERLMKWNTDESDEHDGSEDEATRPTHVISYVPDCPRVQASCAMEEGVVVATCLSSNRVFSRTTGIQLSQLLGAPQCVREAMAVPDADEWKEAIDR